MGLRITFIFKTVGEVDAILDRSLNPNTIEAIVKALPIESTVKTWGEEIYFHTPVKAEQERSKTDVSVGDVAYWPPGQAICIFFGPTPASRGKEPRAASPVNVVGRLLKLDLLKTVKDDCKVKVVEKE